MKELYEMQRIKKQIRNRRNFGMMGAYEKQTINSLLGQNLITDEESYFLIAHLSA